MSTKKKLKAMQKQIDDLITSNEERAEMLVEAIKFISQNRQSIIRLENKDEEKLKVLDQSVFDGLGESWQWAAVDGNSKAYAFEGEPEIDKSGSFFGCVDSPCCKLLVGDYDPTNWQNSLIKRESVELTGYKLCRAMLERGDEFVMCAVGNSIKTVIITGVNGEYFVDNYSVSYLGPNPINNNGNPLTASEVGL